MEFGDFGMREVIWLGLVVVAAYLAVLLLRLLRLGRAPVSPAPAKPRATGMPDLTFIAANGLIKPPPEVVAAAAPPPTDFAEHLEQLTLSRLTAEVEQLRAEVAALRGKLTDERPLQAVSPFYGEAMALAQRGYDARGIADECGISVAEAELLLAMSGRRSEPRLGEKNDGIWRGRAVSGR